MKLIPSKHFKERISERGISWEECEETLNSRKGEEGGIRRKYEKDYADKTIVVLVGETLPSTNNVKGITAWRKES